MLRLTKESTAPSISFPILASKRLKEKYLVEKKALAVQYGELKTEGSFRILVEWVYAERQAVSIGLPMKAAREQPFSSCSLIL